MAIEAPVKLVRLKVRCTDEAQFRRELAARIAAKLFVPTDQPLAKDDLFALQLKFSDGQVHVKGTAKVLKLVDAPKKGVQAKFVSLDTDSLQFTLALDFAPFEDSGPVNIESLLPVSGEHAAHEPAGSGNAAFLDAPTPAPGTVEAAAQAKLIDATKDPFTALSATAVYKRPEQDLIASLKDGGKWSGGLMPLDVLGNYQLLDRLGAGGMAEVYAARATMGSGVEKIVALKLVLPEFGPGTRFGGLFLNEAKISASLAHPGLIQVFDFGEAGARPYLAMEYLRGRDLATVLKRMRAQGVKVPIGFAVHVVLEMVKALDYLHTRTDPDGRWLHLVHRDVSPGNVLVSENGEVKLLDFGVAAAGAVPGKQLVAGKHTYMPPEQLNGQEPSPGWDLYSAGVVLYEMLTLQPLFEGNTAAAGERAERIEQRPPPSQINGDVSPNLDAIVLRATHPDKAQRFPSAKQLRDMLQTELSKLAPADVGAIVRSLFGLDLANEKKKLDTMFLEARAAKSAGGMSAVSANPVRSVRRAIARSRLARAMARRPRLARALAVAWIGLVGFGVYAGVTANTRSRALDEQLERYDAQVASGALSGPGGDTALDHLVAAQRLAPNDARVRERSKSLGQVFELLADKALARGDDAEAAVHLQALLLADPQRPGVAEKLKAAEGRVRDRSKPKAPAP